MKYSFNWIGDQIRLIWGVIRKMEEGGSGISLLDQSSIKLKDSSSFELSGMTAIQGDSTGFKFSLDGTNSYTLPVAKGTLGQTLVTDAAGKVTWKTLIPTPPTTGNFTLKSTAGVLSWVAA